MSTNRQHSGYATLCDPEGIREFDTFSCSHCGRIEHVMPKPAPPPGGVCTACGFKMICDSCVEKGTCDPLEKKLQRLEDADRFRRQLGV